MSNPTNTPSNKQNSQYDPRSTLKSVIGVGKAAVTKVGVKEIGYFIEQQAEVRGNVTISNVDSAGDVGASSGIVLFTATYDTHAKKITRDLVLRHAPNSETRLFFNYDLSRQFKVQQVVAAQNLPVPNTFWLDADGQYLGTPGYIMSQISGVAPNASAFAIGPLAEASPTQRKQMLKELMQAMVKLHQLDVHAIGLEDFVMDAAGNTPLQRCINWYWQTWEWIHLPNYDRLVPIYQWLLDNCPDGKPELMHGDSSLHNYLFKENHLVAMLDWEMSSLGRAEIDLALQCMGNKAFAAPVDSGALQPPSEDEWLEMYQEAGGRPLEHFDYYKKFASYMVIVAVSGLQRNLPADELATQEPLLASFWQTLEA